MKKPEQLFWNLIKKHLPGHVERVENVAFPGFPDINGCYDGREYWIELKAPKTKYYDLEKLLEKSQNVWIYKRLRHFGRVLLLVQGDNYIDILTPRLSLSRKIGGAFGISLVYRAGKPYHWSLFYARIIDAINGVI